MRSAKRDLGPGVLSRAGLVYSMCSWHAICLLSVRPEEKRSRSLVEKCMRILELSGTVSSGVETYEPYQSQCHLFPISNLMIIDTDRVRSTMLNSELISMSKSFDIQSTRNRETRPSGSGVHHCPAPGGGVVFE